LLLFVIRDFTNVTSLGNLAETLKADLEKIWDGLSKPKGKEGSKLNDFFDTDFVGLPHKVFALDKFTNDVGLLSDRFSNSKNDQYIFSSNYHKNIPADGFAAFASSIWECILDNKDLDLPSQKQLLAQFRCDEIERVSFVYNVLRKFMMILFLA
jgi:hypothetical protein